VLRPRSRDRVGAFSRCHFVNLRRIWERNRAKFRGAWSVSKSNFDRNRLGSDQPNSWLHEKYHDAKRTTFKLSALGVIEKYALAWVLVAKAR
jgi:hypothetical protein